MITISFFVLLVLSYIQLCQTRTLWEPALPEISIPITDNKSQKVQITNLNGTLHKTTLSELENVSEIRIIHNQITAIEAGALCPSSSLKILELDLSRNKKPPVLAKSMFDGCHLEELFLKFDYNSPSTIDQDALEDLPNLKKLGIDSLSLPQLKQNFLKLNRNLESLILSNVHVTTIDKNLFRDLPNLEEIEIVHHPELVQIPAGLFKSCSKLKRLVLKDNAIKNLSWDEFRGLSSLEELVVADNQIGGFDGEKIADNMPKLRKLSIEMNPIGREDERSFVQQVKMRLKQLEISTNEDFNL